MELVDFLRARLDEEAALVEGATPGPWWYNPRKQWLDPEAFEKYDLAKGEEFVGYGGPHPFTGAVCATGPASHSQSMADAAHIARFANPARVLADIEAKREVVRLAERAHDYHETFMSGFAAALEQALRMFARAYRDHPDFDPAWLED